MTDRSSVLIVKLDLSSTLKVTVVRSFPRSDLPISVPSRRIVTCPSLLQLPNIKVALPWSQKDVEIAVDDHFWTIHLYLSIVSKTFRQPLSVKTKRFSIFSVSRSQPFSFMFLGEIKSVTPACAQSAVGPIKDNNLIYLLFSNRAT